jgi:hypothetical protein
MNRQAVLQMRAAARSRQVDVQNELRQLHERAIAELANSSTADQVRTEALRQVALWEAGRLCHHSYIEAWRRLLLLPIADMATAVLEDTPEAGALRQNSPFGFVAGRLA